MTQRRQRQSFCVVSILRLLHGPRAKSLSWSNFQQDSLGALPESLHSLAETHCFAQVLAPVLWILRLLRRNPVSGNVREIRNLWRVERQTGHQLRKRLQNRRHHAGMKGMDHLQALAS